MVNISVRIFAMFPKRISKIEIINIENANDRIIVIGFLIDFVEALLLSIISKIGKTHGASIVRAPAKKANINSYILVYFS